jgi:hypothetical protein
MSEERRQRLEARRYEEIEEAASRLLADPNADIAECVRRIDAYSKLLAAMKPRASREWIQAVVVAVCCVSVAGLLWSLRVSGTKIILKIQSEAVALTLAAPWSLSADLSLGTSLVRIQGLTALDALALGLAIESPTGDAWLQLEGGKVSITQLGLSA